MLVFMQPGAGNMLLYHVNSIDTKELLYNVFHIQSLQPTGRLAVPSPVVGTSPILGAQLAPCGGVCCLGRHRLGGCCATEAPRRFCSLVLRVQT